MADWIAPINSYTVDLSEWVRFYYILDMSAASIKTEKIENTVGLLMEQLLTYKIASTVEFMGVDAGRFLSITFAIKQLQKISNNKETEILWSFFRDLRASCIGDAHILIMSGLKKKKKNE